MTAIISLLARSSEEIRANLRRRLVVFKKQEGYLSSSDPSVPLELDAFDKLDTTRHFNAVWSEGKRKARRVVGAARLVLPNPEVARAHGWDHGLPLEEALDLSTVGPPGSVAQVGRFCLDERVRTTKEGVVTITSLFVQMAHESLRHGVKYWVSAANMDCDTPGEARLIHRVIEKKALMRVGAMVSVKRNEAPRGTSRHRFYSEAERALAERGDLRSLRLPRAVTIDAKLAARYVCEPLWDPLFEMYAMPLVSPVEEALASAERYRRLGDEAARAGAVNDCFHSSARR